MGVIWFCRECEIERKEKKNRKETGEKLEDEKKEEKEKKKKMEGEIKKKTSEIKQNEEIIEKLKIARGKDNKIYNVEKINMDQKFEELKLEIEEKRKGESKKMEKMEEEIARKDKEIR